MAEIRNVSEDDPATAIFLHDCTTLGGNSGSCVIDIATGAGHTALAFAPHVREVIASDLTPEMLDEAAKLAASKDYANMTTAAADAERLRDLSARMKPLARKTNPFSGVPRATARTAKWVEPKLVAEIAYTEFTGDGILRHPSFIALREDKDPRSVVRERPKEAP